MLRPQRSGLVRGLIYPVPDPRYPFLGIHLTPRIDGSVLIGPNALLALAREGYGRASFNARDTWATLSWPGFWKMASHNWRTGVEELGYSLSRRRFVERAKRYCPPSLQPTWSGVPPGCVPRPSIATARWSTISASSCRAM